MDKASLVEVDLKKSERIVSALENHGMRVAAALWVHFPEYDDWRFVLAAKDLDPLNIGDAYLKVNRMLTNAGLSVWETPTIFIMKTTDPFVRDLRKSLKGFKKFTDITGMHLGGQTWGDRYIDDAYAYKIA